MSTTTLLIDDTLRERLDAAAAPSGKPLSNQR